VFFAFVAFTLNPNLGPKIYIDLSAFSKQSLNVLSNLPSIPALKGPTVIVFCFEISVLVNEPYFSSSMQAL